MLPHIDAPLNESMRVITGCLQSTHSSFLPILSGITPSETRRSASCLRLYTKALNPKHLLHKTLYLKPSPKCLRSRKPLRSFVEWLSINGEPTTPIPAALQSFIPAFGPQPPGCDLPRNAWVQLNRLRTGVGWFAANMKLMSLCSSDLCECGKVQTAHHILHDCTKFKPPHQWGGWPCYFEIPYPIKVLTNMYSCLCIQKKHVVWKYTYIKPCKWVLFTLRMFQDKCNHDCNRDYFQCNCNCDWLHCDFGYS